MKKAILFCALAVMVAACNKVENPTSGTQEYNIAVTASTGGKARAAINGAEVTKAVAGAQITLIAVENDGYDFVEWTTTTQGITIATPISRNTTFTMPEHDVVILAGFEEEGNTPTEYAITLSGGVGGSVVATVNGSQIYRAASGVEVTITATENTGYEFVEWTTSSSITIAAPTSKTTTFTMPRREVAIAAEFFNLAESTYDAGVVINGIKWATRNVYRPGRFALRAEDPGLFYQWGRKTGWMGTKPLRAYGTDGVIEGATYDGTNYVGTSWTAENSPCPTGWKVATREDFESFADDTKVRSEWVNGLDGDLNGGRFTDLESGSTLFLPAAGYGHTDNGTVDAGGFAPYWTATSYNDANGYFLYLNSDGLSFRYTTRNNLFPVRCVSAE